jgi:hypothetical protein
VEGLDESADGWSVEGNEEVSVPPEELPDEGREGVVDVDPEPAPAEGGEVVESPPDTGGVEGSADDPPSGQFV